MRPTVLDLFAGIGGLSDGFRQAGCEVLGGIEWDKDLADLYKRNHRRYGEEITVLTEDVRTVDLDSVLRQFSIEPGQLSYLVGGSPCQGYSTIGKRELHDERNALIFEFPRYLRRLKPRAFLIENVPGFVTFDDGKRLERLLEALADAGYANCRYQLINAAACGVPQRRRRIVIFGTSHGDLPSFDDLVEPTDHGPTVWDAIGDLPDPHVLLKKHDPGTKVPHGNKTPSRYAKRLRAQTKLISHWEPVIHTREIIDAYRKVEQGKTDPSTKCWRLSKDGHARTLRAGSRSRTACRPIHPVEPRVITVREAARLHSFADSYRFPTVKSHAHVAIGNAVPPLLGKGLATRFNAALEPPSESDKPTRSREAAA